MSKSRFRLSDKGLRSRATLSPDKSTSHSPPPPYHKTKKSEIFFFVIRSVLLLFTGYQLHSCELHVLTFTGIQKKRQVLNIPTPPLTRTWRTDHACALLVPRAPHRLARRGRARHFTILWRGSILLQTSRLSRALSHSARCPRICVAN